MTVRLRGRLPAEEMNGLERHEADLSANPKAKRVVIGVVDVYERRDHHGDGDFQPTVELVQIELPEGRLRDRAVKLLQQAYGKRTGARQLAGFEDDALDENGDETEPAIREVAPGPRYRFEPAMSGAWWLVLRGEDGTLLARKGGLRPDSDLTTQESYTLEQIDAIGDPALSTIARGLMDDALEFEAGDDVGGDTEDADDESPIEGADEKETQDA